MLCLHLIIQVFLLCRQAATLPISADVVSSSGRMVMHIQETDGPAAAAATPLPQQGSSRDSQAANKLYTFSNCHCLTMMDTCCHDR